MLSIKGLVSNNNKLINKNNIKYLVFSLTNNKNNICTINKKADAVKSHNKESDIFYSVSLILQSSGIKDENKK
jgi:hypothetical protein